jgi:hypothetical protein
MLSSFLILRSNNGERSPDDPFDATDESLFSIEDESNSSVRQHIKSRILTKAMVNNGEDKELDAPLGEIVAWKFYLYMPSYLNCNVVLRKDPPPTRIFLFTTRNGTTEEKYLGGLKYESPHYHYVCARYFFPASEFRDASVESRRLKIVFEMCNPLDHPMPFLTILRDFPTSPFLEIPSTNNTIIPPPIKQLPNLIGGVNFSDGGDLGFSRPPQPNAFLGPMTGLASLSNVGAMNFCPPPSFSNALLPPLNPSASVQQPKPIVLVKPKLASCSQVFRYDQVLELEVTFERMRFAAPPNHSPFRRLLFAKYDSISQTDGNLFDTYYPQKSVDQYSGIKCAPVKDNLLVLNTVAMPHALHKWKFFLFFQMTDKIDFYVVTLPEKRFKPNVLLFHGDLWTLQLDRVGCTEFDILIDVYFQDHLGLPECSNSIRLKHPLKLCDSQPAKHQPLLKHTQTLKDALAIAGLDSQRYWHAGLGFGGNQDLPKRRPSERFSQHLERYYKVDNYVLFFFGAFYDPDSLLFKWVNRDVCLEVFKVFAAMLDLPVCFEEIML